ncbi:hypothetical protein PF005_g19590 [Phytophthora fragariae]|uniref:Uncharacterized protein n=1 Tax=Phytophthora fragariae TaxID=53985 RepID=A0A6A4DVT8_9STRA|nr:hypothetical protein PF003_g8828 [Phytophthora fragariae]KAE8940452.1 hypothetical protein PF009_g9731 [Phytophthora fragariae]KAE9090659.1 hypothetical protein PF007_g19154 [Phytophthora fragariae]KAE9118971.1 hypothetical protein PF006_g18464 [Phytophthora fragariae]KAE9189582.1 hypothetical protein PF005_g19590 [Phytophthora fragariae]
MSSGNAGGGSGPCWTWLIVSSTSSVLLASAMPWSRSWRSWVSCPHPPTTGRS